MEKFLNIYFEEFNMFARNTCRESLYGLSVDDFYTINREISEFTDIPD